MCVCVIISLLYNNKHMCLLLYLLTMNISYVLYCKGNFIRLAYTRKFVESSICCMCLRKTENLIALQPTRVDQQSQSVTKGWEERWRVYCKAEETGSDINEGCYISSSNTGRPAGKATCFPGSLYLWPLTTGTVLSRKGSPGNTLTDKPCISISGS